MIHIIILHNIYAGLIFFGATANNIQRIYIIISINAMNGSAICKEKDFFLKKEIIYIVNLVI